MRRGQNAPGPCMGPLVSTSQKDKVLGFVSRVRATSRFVCGGAVWNPVWIAPHRRVVFGIFATFSSLPIPSEFRSIDFGFCVFLPLSEDVRELPWFLHVSSASLAIRTAVPVPPTREDQQSSLTEYHIPCGTSIFHSHKL